mmetsp:Transcript_8182/g.19423  ORF Transcript_8182/g.19423 Transcript_8182/m.19423 type:complete len:166 (-) Transcript_8182:181-678(-)|eukprot:CAMPEP_0182585018 /NCGR_PEP_ID=MMETSP1324-20130603/59275_1 /TAXON_ID=236786 /ORGANISM="Florenciella sp., Strain RCC1587" /LENGTH=165 /DNA_ID=CAMNT_0024801787 /DNA_START=165 /DNA_END=662 /DNA_ORIENTATION=-
MDEEDAPLLYVTGSDGTYGGKKRGRLLTLAARRPGVFFCTTALAFGGIVACVSWANATNMNFTDFFVLWIAYTLLALTASMGGWFFHELRKSMRRPGPQYTVGVSGLKVESNVRAGDVERPWTLDKVALSSNPMGALAESVVEGAGGCCADETSSVDGEQVTMTF